MWSSRKNTTWKRAIAAGTDACIVHTSMRMYLNPGVQLYWKKVKQTGPIRYSKTRTGLSFQTGGIWRQ